MTVADFIATLPEEPTAEREEAFLRAAVDGKVAFDWELLTVTANGVHATIWVTGDALAVVDGAERLRFNVNATTAQRISDYFEALLPTTKISDDVFAAAAVLLTPCIQAPDARMANTSRMLRHSAEVEKKRAGRGGLIATVGKDWVITNRLDGRPDRAANYGWHDKLAPNGKVWQPLGLAHSRFHVDYSQVVRLVRRKMQIDGAERDLVDVLADPKLAALVSNEGPIKGWRMAAVERTLASVPAKLPDAPAVVAPEDAVPRILRQGMRGPDVAAWQRFLGLTADGIFGPNTLAATKKFQVDNGLSADGVVGPKTRAKAATNEPIKFLQAKHFKAANRTAIDLIVIHSMEALETEATAENVAAWFASANSPVASAHYCIDDDSIVQCVKDKDVAYHAPGANHNGLGLEHAGYAKQSAEDWADTYSETMLRRSARLSADLCTRNAIPIELVGVEGLIDGRRGITTHAAVSLAFHESTHTDPGPQFPMDHYLALVREYAG